MQRESLANLEAEVLKLKRGIDKLDNLRRNFVALARASVGTDGLSARHAVPSPAVATLSFATVRFDADGWPYKSECVHVRVHVLWTLEFSLSSRSR